MEKNKRNIIICICLSFTAILYTFLVKIIDVKAIGPNNSEVGLSNINLAFHNLTGYHEKIYQITEILGYLILLIMGGYAILGFIQLVKRKSIKKVDREIMILGGLYVAMLLIYVFFEKVIINYRPVMIDGVLEASYPSSHTMLALVTCLSAIIVNKKYLKKNMLKIANSAILILMIMVFIGRTISGVHWLSDILGGVIISMVLLMLFYTVYRFPTNKKVLERKKA